MRYIHSIDGVSADGVLHDKLPQELVGVDKPTRIANGWYDYVSTAPTVSGGEVVICVGFVRLGDDFTGVYEIRDIPPAPSHDEEATEADKDAALRRLGVEVDE